MFSAMSPELCIRAWRQHWPCHPSLTGSLDLLRRLPHPGPRLKLIATAQGLQLHGLLDAAQQSLQRLPVGRSLPEPITVSSTPLGSGPVGVEVLPCPPQAHLARGPRAPVGRSLQTWHPPTAVAQSSTSFSFFFRSPPTRYRCG